MASSGTSDRYDVTRSQYKFDVPETARQLSDTHTAYLCRFRIRLDLESALITPSYSELITEEGLAGSTVSTLALG
jgi:hypothetical protein